MVSQRRQSMAGGLVPPSPMTSSLAPLHPASPAPVAGTSIMETFSSMTSQELEEEDSLADDEEFAVEQHAHR